MNITDIIKSWVKTANPSEDQLELALTRKSICDNCPSKTKAFDDVYICGECHCPILYNETPLGKLFSEGNCPLKKW